VQDIFLIKTAAMDIKEPGINPWEVYPSSQSPQNFPQPEQLQTSQVLLEKRQCLYGDWQEVALATSGLGLWNWNLVTDNTYYNPQWKQILGYASEEIENHHTTFERLVHPQDLPKVRQVVKDYLEGRIPVYEVEFRMLSKSGEWKWILDRGKILQWDESGKPVQMVGTHQDITKEKGLEEALSEALRAIAEGGAKPISRKGLASCGNIGVSPVDNHFRRGSCVRSGGVKLNVPWAVPYESIAPNQCPFERLQTEIASRLFIEAQEKKKSQQLEDTQEELKNVREQLLQNDKMAHLGQLVTEVTNEIYSPTRFIHSTLPSASDYAEQLIWVLELYQHYYPNPVSVIASELQRLDLDFVKTDFLKLLWSMRAGSERIQELVFALQNYSHLNNGQMRKTNLHEGLGYVLRILQHRLKAQPNRPRIQIIKTFSELPLVICYPGELNQVFMNILTNAIDALEERWQQDDSFIPQIKICTEVIQSHLSLVSTDNKQLLKQHKVVIRISDNGKGILPHIQRRIFEPFFTTKLEAKRKGLGLSISQQIIVERHQGKLKCHSYLGQGTEFMIELNIKATICPNSRQDSNF
jgi:two-component system, NtrC family, sensor kinase